MLVELDEYCPCCGYDTFKHGKRLNYTICPICRWEDDPTHYIDLTDSYGANGLSLLEARRNFLAFGACREEMVAYARMPRRDDRKKGINN